jgi:CRP-like cAMP-binding protein
MVAEANPLIRKLAHLFPLTPPEQALLDTAARNIVEIETKRDIVRENECPAASNLLLEGMCCRYKILTDGRRQIFTFHVPGDIFDAQSFILQRMDHSVGTLTRCRVAVIPHSVMTHITESYPRLARAIWKDTLVDAAVFREWMASIGRRSAYQRIAHLMCEMFVRLDTVGLTRGREIDWPITQAEVGDALGLSVVHVNRTLQELRANRLITLQGGRLIIHDWDGLIHAGDFDAGYLHLSEVPALARSAE